MNRRADPTPSAGPIVGLVPARNAEPFLEGCLDSLAAVCDAIVALDDGSTDTTGSVLERHETVALVLRNPRRPTYFGWDDGANRNRLLEAAADLRPSWIVSLDADERLPLDDALALRAFLHSDAIRGCAYGFRCHGFYDGDRYNPDFTWIYRAFAYRPGQRFPEQRLDFNPVPTDIPRAAWVRTTIRVQHLESASSGNGTRLRKYQEADPEGRYRSYYEQPRPEAPTPAPRWEPRPASFPVLEGAAAVGHPPNPTAGGAAPKVVCLLQARECADDIPAYMASVSRVADAVVALYDDGDEETAEALADSPLVQVLLKNPRRPSRAGWDDAGNRNKLLKAASELEPDWILLLDADERLPEEDALALRAFIENEAVPGFAYGFTVHRMIDDLQHYDKAGLRVYRLFAHERGQAFENRFHGVPVPNNIPRRRWLDTTLRIQHLASMSEELRQTRFDKYRQVDPDCVHQDDYSHLLTPPDGVKPWEPRPEEAPVLTPRSQAILDEELSTGDIDLDGPVLSAIVISRNDEAHIERAVRSVVEQECPEPFEVIVVTSGSDRTADIVRSTFPTVRLVELDGPALPGVARNAGLRVARGDYVSFPGSHVELPPGSLAARLRAHELGYDMVTGTMLNGTRTRSGWASYFLDNSHCLPGRPSGELRGAPARCSYRADALRAVGGFPEDMRTGEDTVVNRALYRRGATAYRSAEVVLTHNSPCRRVPTLLRHHFERGQGMGRILRQDAAEAQRRVLTRPTARTWLRRYIPDRLTRTTTNIDRWGGDLVDEYRRVYPLVAAGAAAAWVGMWFELLRPSRRASEHPPAVLPMPQSGRGPRPMAEAS